MAPPYTWLDRQNEELERFRMQQEEEQRRKMTPRPNPLTLPAISGPLSPPQQPPQQKPPMAATAPQPASPTLPKLALPTPEIPTVEEPATPNVRPPLYSGMRTENMTPLQAKETQLKVTQNAPVGGRVFKSNEGYEVEPARKPSRWKQALIGALHGAAMGGRSGSLGGLIGGAGVGAASGGISPKVVQSFTRDLEIRRLQGEISDEQAMTMKNAQIGETEAQTYQRYQQPELDALRIQRQYDRDAAADEDRDSRMEMAREAEENRQTRFEEQEEGRNARHRDTLNKPTAGDAAAAEGAATSELEGRAAEEVRSELDGLKRDRDAGNNAINVKDALWKARAAQIMKADRLNETSMAEALAIAQSEDEDFKSGTYNTTVTNTKSKETRIAMLEKELLEIAARGRGGAAKSARGGRRGKVFNLGQWARDNEATPEQIAETRKKFAKTHRIIE